MSTVTIDWQRCRGHGVCSAALPELLELDEWGYPIVKDSTVSDDLKSAARLAVATCPAAALRLQR